MKKKAVIWGLIVAMCLSACGKGESAGTDAKSEASVTSAVSAETSVSTETGVTNDVDTEASVDTEKKEDKADFFAIRPITSVSNEMPEGIYTPGETSTYLSDDLARCKKNGCTMLVDSETWPSLDRDYYRKTFPHSIVETCESTKKGETFREMIERVSYSLKKMFLKDDLYAGHENELSSVCFSEDGKRACLMYYEAKEKVAYVTIFKHVAHKESKKGEVTDYYMYIITGEKLSNIDDADKFYEEVATLGVYFDGEVSAQASAEPEKIPGGVKDIYAVDKWRVDGTGKEYSATELVLHNSVGQAWINRNCEDTGFVDYSKTEFRGGNGLGTEDFTITDDTWHVFENEFTQKIGGEKIDNLSYNNEYYSSLEDFFAYYQSLFFYDGKDARGYYKYLVSEDGKNGISIFNTSYAGRSNDTEVNLYQQVGTCKKSGSEEELPVYRIVTFHMGEGDNSDVFYARLEILGIHFKN